MKEKMASFSHVYIDESGDLGSYGSKYFVVAAIKIDNPLTLSRIIKKLREKKLNKKIKELHEIKANNSNRKIREYILENVRKINCEIFVI